MKAFVTGSRAYGKPRRSSDIDLVIFCDEETKALLLKHGGKTFKFGKIQVIPCTDKTTYEIWRKGTEQLVDEAPVMRERAIKVFEKYEEQAGGAKDGYRKEA